VTPPNLTDWAVERTCVTVGQRPLRLQGSPSSSYSSSSPSPSPFSVTIVPAMPSTNVPGVNVGVPLMTPLCPSLFQARQFEYHPSESLMGVGTTTGEVCLVDWESNDLVGREILPKAYRQGEDDELDPSSEEASNVLALAWLAQRPDRLIAGCANGGAAMYKVDLAKAKQMVEEMEEMKQQDETFNVVRHAYSIPHNPIRSSRSSTSSTSSSHSASAASSSSHPTGALSLVHSYQSELTQRMTSLHANATSTLLAASGYTTTVNIMDLETGQLVRRMRNIHGGHINITRFANHMPHLLLTCSFDKEMKMFDLRCNRSTSSNRSGSIHASLFGGGISTSAGPSPVPIYTCRSKAGNVMVTFAPNDLYFLSSGVDNEVVQWTTVDGRASLRYPIPQLHSPSNYTRSYYLNEGEAIVSGSSSSEMLYVASSVDGSIIDSIDMSEGRKDNHLYVQSLRGCPLPTGHNRCTVLLFYKNSPTNQPYEMCEVNMNRSPILLADCLDLGATRPNAVAKGELSSTASAPLTHPDTAAPTTVSSSHNVNPSDCASRSSTHRPRLLPLPSIERDLPLSLSGILDLSRDFACFVDCPYAADVVIACRTQTPTVTPKGSISSSMPSHDASQSKLIYAHQAILRARWPWFRRYAVWKDEAILTSHSATANMKEQQTSSSMGSLDEDENEASTSPSAADLTFCRIHIPHSPLDPTSSPVSSFHSSPHPASSSPSCAAASASPSYDILTISSSGMISLELTRLSRVDVLTMLEFIYTGSIRTKDEEEDEEHDDAGEHEGQVELVDAARATTTGRLVSPQPSMASSSLCSVMSSHLHQTPTNKRELAGLDEDDDDDNDEWQQKQRTRVDRMSITGLDEDDETGPTSPTSTSSSSSSSRLHAALIHLSLHATHESCFKLGIAPPAVPSASPSIPTPMPMSDMQPAPVDVDLASSSNVSHAHAHAHAHPSTTPTGTSTANTFSSAYEGLETIYPPTSPDDTKDASPSPTTPVAAALLPLAASPPAASSTSPSSSSSSSSSPSHPHLRQPPLTRSFSRLFSLFRWTMPESHGGYELTRLGNVIERMIRHHMTLYFDEAKERKKRHGENSPQSAEPPSIVHSTSPNSPPMSSPPIRSLIHKLRCCLRSNSPGLVSLSQDLIARHYEWMRFEHPTLLAHILPHIMGSTGGDRQGGVRGFLSRLEQSFLSAHHRLGRVCRIGGGVNIDDHPCTPTSVELDASITDYPLSLMSAAYTILPASVTATSSSPLSSPIIPSCESCMVLVSGGYGQKCASPSSIVHMLNPSSLRVTPLSVPYDAKRRNGKGQTERASSASDAYGLPELLYAHTATAIRVDSRSVARPFPSHSSAVASSATTVTSPWSIHASPSSPSVQSSKSHSALSQSDRHRDPDRDRVELVLFGGGHDTVRDDLFVLDLHTMQWRKMMTSQTATTTLSATIDEHEHANATPFSPSSTAASSSFPRHGTIDCLPRARRKHSATAVPALHTIFIFGGRDRHSVFADLHAIDYSDRWKWTCVPMAELLQAGAAAAAAGGGEGEGGEGAAPPFPPNPAPRYGHTMTYSPQLGALILIGGFSVSGPRNDVWVCEMPPHQHSSEAISPAVQLQRMYHSPAHHGAGSGYRWVCKHKNDPSVLQGSYAFYQQTLRGGIRDERAPLPRFSHSSCLITLDAHEYICVYGGLVAFNQGGQAALDDLWLLSLESWEWRRIQPRNQRTRRDSKEKHRQDGNGTSNMKSSTTTHSAREGVVHGTRHMQHGAADPHDDDDDDDDDDLSSSVHRRHRDTAATLTSRIPSPRWDHYAFLIPRHDERSESVSESVTVAEGGWKCHDRMAIVGGSTLSTPIGWVDVFDFSTLLWSRHSTTRSCIPDGSTGWVDDGVHSHSSVSVSSSSSSASAVAMPSSSSTSSSSPPFSSPILSGGGLIPTLPLDDSQSLWKNMQQCFNQTQPSPFHMPPVDDADTMTMMNSFSQTSTDGAEPLPPSIARAIDFNMTAEHAALPIPHTPLPACSYIHLLVDGPNHDSDGSDSGRERRSVSRVISIPKVILSSRSSLFRAMLSSNLLDRQTRQYGLMRLGEGIKYEVMRAVVYYLYCGDIQFQIEHQSQSQSQSQSASAGEEAVADVTGTATGSHVMMTHGDTSPHPQLSSSRTVKRPPTDATSMCTGTSAHGAASALSSSSSSFSSPLLTLDPLELLVVSDRLQLSSFASVLEVGLSRQLSVGVACTFLSFAESYHLHMLTKLATIFIIQHWEEIKSHYGIDYSRLSSSLRHSIESGLNRLAGSHRGPNNRHEPNPLLLTPGARRRMHANANANMTGPQAALLNALRRRTAATQQEHQGGDSDGGDDENDDDDDDDDDYADSDGVDDDAMYYAMVEELHAQAENDDDDDEEEGDEEAFY